MDQLETPESWHAQGEDKTDSGIGGAERSSGPHGYEARGSRLKSLAILLFAVFMFFVFLFLKLPEARIQNLVIAHIRIIAQEQGFLFSAEKVRIGVFFGPSVKIYNAELKAIDNERQVLKIPYLKVRPHIFSMLGSVKKIGISAELLDGDLSGTVGASTTGETVVDLDLDSLDLSATNVLKKFLPIDLTAKLNGTIRLHLDPADPHKSEGEIKLKAEKLNAPAQSLFGFSLPKLTISEIKIDVPINQGKFEFKEFEVGKDGKGDDIVGKLTGEGQLSRLLDRSTINAKAVFTLSQSVKSSIPLLDALLGQAKTPDGKYAYKLGGTLSGIEAVPGG